MHVHVGAGRSRLQSSVEAMHGGSCAGAHFKFALLLALAPGARGQHQDCAFAPFYQPEELPAIHQLDMTIPQEVFDSLIQHSTDRSYREQTGQLNFNGIQYENVEIMVHGGDPLNRGTLLSYVDSEGSTASSRSV